MVAHKYKKSSPRYLFPTHKLTFPFVFVFFLLQSSIVLAQSSLPFFFFFFLGFFFTYFGFWCNSNNWVSPTLPSPWSLSPNFAITLLPFPFVLPKFLDCVGNGLGNDEFRWWSYVKSNRAWMIYLFIYFLGGEKWVSFFGLIFSKKIV